MIVLRELSDNDEAAFFNGLKEWPEGDLAWYTFAWKPGMTYAAMLELLRKERLGIDLAPGRVAHTMLYGFLGEKIVGRLSVRHELNESLQKRGGHIGYAVAPLFRKKGYATEMLRQGLDYCRSLGLKEIMITCAVTNEPSLRIIEKLGPSRSDRAWDEVDEEMIQRYWLKL